MDGLECQVNEFVNKYDDIINMDGRFTVKGSPKVVKLPTILTNDVCRFLGILHGDGNMSFKRIHITDKSRRYHKEVIAPLFQNIFGIKLNIFNDKNRNTYYSHVKCSIIYRLLTDVFEVPKGSVRRGLSIPMYLKQATKENKASYIAGLFDAEGHVSKRQAQVGFSTTSKNLFEFVTKFLDTVFVRYSRYIRNRRKNTEYEIHIYGKENVRKFMNLVKMKHPDKVSRFMLPVY